MWSSTAEETTLKVGLPPPVVALLDRAHKKCADLASSAASAAAALEAQRVNEEQQLHSLEQRLVALRSRCEATARDLKVSDAAKGVLQSEKTRAESELVELRSSKALSARQQAALQEAQTRALELAERRQEDVDARDRELAQLRERCAAAEQRAADFDVKVRESEEKQWPLRSEVLKLKQEDARLKQHQSWLETELETKSDEMLALRKKTTAQIFELQGRVDAVDALRERGERAAKALERAEARAASLQEELEEVQRAADESAAISAQELSTQKQLVALIERSRNEERRQKESLEEADGVLRERLKTKAEAGEKRQREHAAELKAIATEHRDNVSAMQAQLDAAKAAQRSADAAAVTAAKEGQASSALVVAGDANSAGSSSGAMTLAQHVQINKLEDALEREHGERLKLETYLARIEKEIMAKVRLQLSLCSYSPSSVMAKCDCAPSLPRPARPSAVPSTGASGQRPFSRAAATAIRCSPVPPSTPPECITIRNDDFFCLLSYSFCLRRRCWKRSGRTTIARCARTTS